jgi:hypothetical protein
MDRLDRLGSQLNHAPIVLFSERWAPLSGVNGLRSGHVSILRLIMLMWHVSIGCFIRFGNIYINHPVIVVNSADCALSYE